MIPYSAWFGRVETMSLGIASLLSLWILPALALLYCVVKEPEKAGEVTGITLGIVAYPASLGLYGLFYNGNPLGFVGLFLCFLHSSIPGLIATAAGIDPAKESFGFDVAAMVTISAATWGFIYGLIGMTIDSIISAAPKHA